MNGELAVSHSMWLSYIYYLHTYLRTTLMEQTVVLPVLAPFIWSDYLFFVLPTLLFPF
jgi:hypothetical protein